MPNMADTKWKHHSLASIHESELVRRLMADAHWRSRVIGLHGIPDGVVPSQDISLEGLPGGPSGDIDLLLLPPGQPEHATAVQVKRVKVQADTFLTETPNKLHELAKGKRQANILEAIGFSQVYFFVFVVVDSRIRNGERISYEGLTPQLRSMIDNAISLNEPHSRVGLVHFEFVQPMDDEPLRTGTFHGHLKRLAQPSTQPVEVTKWITGMKV